MTSWRCVTHLFLIVFLSTINPSKGGCDDYFKVHKWVDNLTDNIPLVETKNPKHIVECSVERESLRGVETMSGILDQCFDRIEEAKEVTEKCQGNASQTLPFYNFMCLVAKLTASQLPEGCEYETTCKLQSETATADSDQTTLPPTTTDTTTATLPPPTTLPERTTAATTTTKTTTTVLTPTARLPTTSTKFTKNAQEGSNESQKTNKGNTEEIWKMLFMGSAFLNVVGLGLLTAYLCRRTRTTQLYEPPTVILFSNEAASEAQPVTEIQLNTQMASTHEDEEESLHSVEMAA